MTSKPRHDIDQSASSSSSSLIERRNFSNFGTEDKRDRPRRIGARSWRQSGHVGSSLWQRHEGAFRLLASYWRLSGGQAEYVRVPFSDVGPIVIPDGLPDDKVLFLSDILPTGWMAAENCAIEPGDTVAVWGCGPVGLFAIEGALIMGAQRVIAIDHYPGRLQLAKHLGAEIL
jgi:threonine dehydrogenase-like Zn-dependent dehydrogenase